MVEYTLKSNIIDSLERISKPDEFDKWMVKNEINKEAFVTEKEFKQLLQLIENKGSAGIKGEQSQKRVTMTRKKIRKF